MLVVLGWRRASAQGMGLLGVSRILVRLQSSQLRSGLRIFGLRGNVGLYINASYLFNGLCDNSKCFQKSTSFFNIKTKQS
jgi:hypothetical protein